MSFYSDYVRAISMAAGISPDLEGFNRFVAESLRDRELSLEECLAAYRVYQAEIARFRAEIAPALSDLDAGNTSTIDIDAVVARGKATLAGEGITG